MRIGIKHNLKLIKLFNPPWTWYYLGLAGLVAFALISCTSNEVQEEQTVLTSVEQGAELYNTYCFSCHSGDSGGEMMDIPPRHNANGHTWHHPDCQLTDIILNSSGEMGEMMRQMMGVPEDVPPMPTFKEQLSEEEVAAILGYIKTWWTEEQREFQADVTQDVC